MKVSYIKTNLPSIFNISKIVTIHYYEFDKNFVFAGERHDFWEMVYVDKGPVRIRRDDEIIMLQQGDIIFHRPNEFHSIRAIDSPINFFVVSFVCESAAMQSLERYHTSLEASLKPFISAVIRESENTYIIPKNDPTLAGLARNDTAPPGGEQLIKTYLEQLFIYLLRGMTVSDNTRIFPSKESMENHLVVATKRLITEKCEENIRVGEICRTIGYSKSYLCKLFREQCGETIISYSIRKKIDRAKQLIREGNLNFSEISDRLAFDNPQYFSRVFKRVMGMTPTEFRRTLFVQE